MRTEKSNHEPAGCCAMGLCGPEAAQAAREQSKRLARNKARRERDQSMRDIGLVKVKGALGGTYWE